MSIALVQQVGNASTVASPGTALTSTATVFTAGNLLVALISFAYSGAGASGTLDVPAGWTAPLATKNNGAPNGCSRVYFMPNNPGGSQSWTWNVTMGGGGTAQGQAWTIFEISGADLVSPLDLTVVNNATGASASATLDTLAASGTTINGDLLLDLVGVQRSTAGTLTTDTTNSVPTTGWTVGTQFSSTNAGPNAHASGQYQILPGTQVNPRGVLTSSISESSESWLLTFKAASGVVDPGYLPSVRISNRGTGPRVLRYLFRETSGPFTFAPPPPPPDPGYLPPILIGNEYVGPPALRRIFKRPFVWTLRPGPPIGLWLAQKQTTITALISPYLAQNGTWTENDIGWYDINGGIKIGYMKDYGGGVFSSWYELDGSGNEIGQNNDNLATNRPDGIIHLATVASAFFTGTEEGVFATPTEQVPVGTTFRRGLQIRVPIAGADSNKFDWTVTDYLYPGDPFFRVVRIDQHNTLTAPLDGVNALEFAQVAGLNNNLSEWPAASTGYGTVGGSVTSPVPQTQTAGEPDYFYANPGGSAGKILGIVGIKKTAIADSNYTNVNFQLNANVTPRTKIYYQADVTSVPAGTTKTSRIVTAFKRNMTQAQAVSIAADIKTPDTAFTNVTLGTSSGFVDDEGLYAFNSTNGSSIQFQHSISGNVTKRWLCIYKVTNWTAAIEGTVAIGSTVLTANVDYLAYIDSTNHVLYLKLMGGIVPSGAGANEWNNGIISFTPAGSTNVFVTISDTVSAVSDAVVRSAQSFSRTASDSLGSISDSVLRGIQNFLRTSSDTIATPSDSVTRNFQSFIRTVSDSLGSITDAVARSVQSFPRTVTDSLGVISDSVARSSQSFSRTVSDSLNAISDSVNRGSQSFLRTVSDTLGAISDSIASFTGGGSHISRTVTDSLSAISDSVARSSQSFNRTISDTIAAISDTVTRNAQAFTRTISDTIATPSDAIIRSAQTIARTVSDSLGAITDSVVRAAQSFSRVVSDSLSAISDSVTQNVKLPRIIADALGAISDTATAQRGVARTISDSLGAISDSVARSSQSITRTISDTLNPISDSVTRNAQSMLRTLADTLGAISDSVLSQRGVSRTVSDSISAISDAVTRNIGLQRPISDTLNSITDSIIRSPQLFTRTVTDFLQGILDSVVQGAGSIFFFEDRGGIITSRDGNGQVYSRDGGIITSRDGKGEIH